MYNNQTTEQTTTKGITGSKLDRVQYLLIITALTCPSDPVREARPFGYELMIRYDVYANMGHVNEACGSLCPVLLLPC